ncbi:tetratricopeptide repeat protein [Siansivirga zeaxanthinifaciens]|uniref:Tetratricopeptide repeat protein n=1 Tax=Siansivirga zeaxanthinifaciens CC-SAMT-1 TaxID=1454006 RepID=A0A0C5W7J8_9FLAO|nr:tetratricopeptide repeat protein [Siansivirga zeaxanthinifaciens]AJR03123.1 hypothetical protein AW14_05185 [Siansivirga zeaxanthinifaciens CC-SAMT-1]
MEDQDYILFESYLSNELPADEIATFEKRLKTDAAFHSAFELYKETALFLEKHIENEVATETFKKNLQKISDKHFVNLNNGLNKTANKKLFNLFKYAAAASIVLMVGIFTIGNLMSPDYSDYSNYEPISLTVRGENDALLKTAETSFNNKDFEKAESAFKSILVLDNNNAEIKLYSAIANLELNNYNLAEELLVSLQNGNSVFKNKATWYLALSKLKQGEEEYCIEILKTIPEDAEAYQQAQKLLNKLD